MVEWDVVSLTCVRVRLVANALALFSRGLWPNLLKVAPSMATSFFVYETVKTTITEHMQTL
jgi:solute carrier family 25 phosphate transporter 23/24/25/41